MFASYFFVLRFFPLVCTVWTASREGKKKSAHSPLACLCSARLLARSLADRNVNIVCFWGILAEARGRDLMRWRMVFVPPAVVLR